MKKIAFNQIAEFITIYAILGMLALACSTTTIQTGGTQYRGPENYRNDNQRAMDPESSFFNEMSSKDDAFREKSREIAPDTENSSQTVENNTQKEDVAVLNREFDNKEQLQEKDPIDYNREAVDQSDVAKNDSSDYELYGVSSWYGRDFDGKPTASGVIYDSRKLTAAHKEIPLGSIALIRNTQNDKEVLVTINDRGPFIKGRILDVSEYSAELLGFKEQGLTNVEIKIVRLGKSKISSKGATYDFFGPESGYTSNAGAGDDPDANAQIDAMLDKEQKKSEIAVHHYDYEKIQNEREQVGYAVQIGVFSDKRNALELKKYVSESKKIMEPIFVYQRDNSFKVKVGSWSTAEEASKTKRQLIDAGFRAFVSAPSR